MTAVSSTLDLDLFSDALLEDPFPSYRQLRESGGAVWLSSADAWAVSRYEDVRKALAHHEIYTSTQGVGLNDLVNQATAGTVLCSEPPVHDLLRSVLAEQLSPRAVRCLGAAITEQADQLVTTLLQRGHFDAITDLAQVFTPSVVADLIGVPAEVRRQLLPWGNAVFDAMGPWNARTEQALPMIREQSIWLAGLRTDDLAIGSMGRAIYQAAEVGLIDQASAPPLFWAYTGAGVDTTVSAIGSAIGLLASNPVQFQRLRDDPTLIPRAFTEALRLESPIQVFTRVLREQVELDGTVIPAGQRMIMLYGSANRDERHFGPTADQFDVTRTPNDHLAFGYGLHSCAGQMLARLQAHAVLGALVAGAAELRPAGPPVRHLNNTMRSLAHLPLTVTLP